MAKKELTTEEIAINERFKQCFYVLEKKNNFFTKREFCNSIGLKNQSQLSTYFNNTEKTSKLCLKNICKVYDVNMNFLMSGNGGMFNNTPSKANNLAHLPTIEELRLKEPTLKELTLKEKILKEPVIKEKILKEIVNEPETQYNISNKKEISGYYYSNVNTDAGFDIVSLNEDNNRVPVKIPNFEGKNLTFINVFGDSMYPKFSSGNIIGIRMIEPQYLFFGGVFVVKMKNGSCTLKYIRKGKDDEHFKLCSENPLYDDREYHLSLIDEIYEVIVNVSKLTI